MNTSILCSIETTQKQRKAKQMIDKLHMNKDILLHPLQREQNLLELLEERDNNKIMRDFSIDSLRHHEINEL